MRCPFCKQPDSRGIDSRAADEGTTIRRRRECSKCGRRFTTYEVVERLPLMVVKRDNRREPFSRDKLLTGIIRSCDKRDISMEQITNFVAEIEHEIRNRTEPEVPSEKVGEIVMEHLKDFDEVAYIRFASVYRKFDDITNFIEELETLRAHREKE